MLFDFMGGRVSSKKISINQGLEVSFFYLTISSDQAQVDSNLLSKFCGITVMMIFLPVLKATIFGESEGSNDIFHWHW
jgi:hypothetical protein